MNIQDIVKKYNIGLENLYNTERKFDFMNELYNDKSDFLVRNIFNTFNRIGFYENKIKKDLCEFNENNLRELFSLLKINYATFVSLKSPLKKYVKWCNKNEYCQFEQVKMIENMNEDILPKEDIIKNNYFHDFNDLFFLIEYIFTQIEIRKAETVLNLETIRIAIYLAWFGVELKDVIKIKKIDIDAERNLIFIESKNEYVKIDSIKAFKKIIEYRDSIQYNGVKFENSEFFLRSKTHKKNFILFLRNLISKYFGDNQSSNIVNCDRNISYDKVYWSGIYYRAVNSICKESIMDVEFMSKIFKEDYSVKSGYHLFYIRYRNFLSYCQYMYPEFYKYLTKK